MTEHERIVRLESWVSHQERVVDQLNEELLAQQREVGRLRDRLDRVVRRLVALEPEVDHAVETTEDAVDEDAPAG